MSISAHFNTLKTLLHSKKDSSDDDSGSDSDSSTKNKKKKSKDVPTAAAEPEPEPEPAAVPAVDPEPTVESPAATTEEPATASATEQPVAAAAPAAKKEKSKHNKKTNKPKPVGAIRHRAINSLTFQEELQKNFPPAAHKRYKGLAGIFYMNSKARKTLAILHLAVTRCIIRKSMHVKLGRTNEKCGAKSGCSMPLHPGDVQQAMAVLGRKIYV